jgi:hypothetical protein
MEAHFQEKVPCVKGRVEFLFFLRKEVVHDKPKTFVLSCWIFSQMRGIQVKPNPARFGKNREMPISMNFSTMYTPGFSATKASGPRFDRVERTGLRLPAFLALLLLSTANFAAQPKDRLHHLDGSVIEGKILFESPQEVRIETKYWTLTYEKIELARVERGLDESTKATTTPAVTPVPPDFSSFIPAGPVNPYSPPQAPSIAMAAASGITPPPQNKQAIPAPSPSPSQGMQQMRAAPSPHPAPAGTDPATEFDGLIAIATGTVQIVRGGKVEPAPAGSGIHTGDTLVTGDGQARITLRTGIQIVLTPNSSLNLAGIGPAKSGVDLLLGTGAAWFDASSQVESKLFTVTAAGCQVAPDPSELQIGATVKVSIGPAGRITVATLKGKVIVFNTKSESITMLPGQTAIDYDPASGQGATSSVVGTVLEREWQSTQ